ncbi:MAG: hypothetical protein AAB946_02160 [Patescibacteria group bacterium]
MIRGILSAEAVATIAASGSSNLYFLLKYEALIAIWSVNGMEMKFFRNVDAISKLVGDILGKERTSAIVMEEIKSDFSCVSNNLNKLKTV